MSETREEKLAFVAKQRKEIAKQSPVPLVTCFCGKCLNLLYMYRCLYCGEFYCPPCAEAHFGQTRAEYAAAQKAKGVETVSDVPLALENEEAA